MSKQIPVSHSENIPDVCPLTDSQNGIYIESLNNPDSTMYNISFFFCLPNGTDSTRFIASVKKAAKLHKVFNVTVSAAGGIPSMIYNENEITVTENEITDLKSALKEHIVPFDIEKGPLYRFYLFHLGDKDVFFIDVHHIIFDGSSVKAFISDVAEIYDGGVGKGEELTIFDISSAENSVNCEDAFSDDMKFFDEKLGNSDGDSKPVSDLVYGVGIGTGTITISTADKLSIDAVCKYAKKHNISENSVLLGAFAYTLAKFNGARDCNFSTVYHGRSDARLASSVGMFVKTIPLCFAIDDNQKVSEFLTSVYNDYYQTKIHSSVPFSKIAAKYGVNADIAFVFQQRLFGDIKMNGDLIKVNYVDFNDCISDIDLMVMQNENDYKFFLQYRKNLYSDELMESFLKMYMNAASSMLTADILGDVEFTDTESKAILDGFNKTECDYDCEKTVIDIFREQVKKTPDNICLVYSDKRFTYREIDEITDILAKNLRAKGICREKVVGVLIPRCEYMLICSLGILKAGGAYLPLDPSYPAERLNLMVSDSGAEILFYSSELSDIITSDFTGERICVDDISSMKDMDIALEAPNPEDMFVMLYTSGSTGVPKGVMFEHSNTLVTTQWVKKYFNMNETSRVTSYASYGFDAHTFDIYPTITSGAQLHIISEDIRLDFIALRKYFNDNGITHTVMTTQIGRQFALMGGFETLRHISVAGEKLTPLDVPEGLSLYNLYGPTEGSVITSAFKIDKRCCDVPIGTAVDNLKLYITDKKGRLLPTGAVGELWISGPHVTRGYLNRPEKNAEAYGENPFDTQIGYERIYRTGDIIRLLPDGNMQFIGRRDAQVKIRGFRVELTEIEEIIRRYPNISDATVAAFDDPSGGKFIAAYVVSDKKLSPDDIAEFIHSEKPPYMVPAVIMQIDKIPLTPNQKVNKRALPIPKRTPNDTTPPENDTQKKIFDIISDVIGHNEFGINTNIYDAGLTSIGAVKLNVMLAEAFDITMRIADIKANDTVKKLEKFIGSLAPVKIYEKLDYYPITQSQNGIFIESAAAPDTTIYNIPVLIRIGDGIDVSRLSEAVKKAIDAHSYVKTRLFTDESGNIRSKRRDSDEVNVPIVRCASVPASSELVKPFSLIDSPLYRAAIYETDDGNYLFMDFHHIICDGTSEGILMRDISRAYSGEELKSEEFSGFEAALEEEELLRSDRYTEAKEYWKGLLSGCETSCLPKADPEAESGSRLIHFTSSANGGAITDFCNKNSLSLNAFFNSVFAFVLSRFTGSDSVSYDTVYNGRNNSRLADSVLFSARTIPVTADFGDNDKTLDFIKAVQSQLVNSMANDACAFAELARDYGIKSDIILVYQGDEFKFDSLCGESAELIGGIAPDTAKAPVTINIFLSDGRFEYDIEYRRDIFCEAFARSLADSISAAADEFVRCEFIRDISILSENGEAVYTELNNNTVPIDDILCHRIFEKYAQQTPDTVAVTANGESLTYGELNARANMIANSLIKLGVTSDTVIGLLLDRTKEIPMTELGIIKSGGAFLPMLPEYPDDRIDFCLRGADSPYIITTEAIKNGKPELFTDEKPYRVLTVEELTSSGETGNPDVKISGTNLVYCIYTSGSTGTPKGVMIEHRNFTNFIQTQIPVYEFLRNPEIQGSAICTSSISFDMSIMELMLPLFCGKTLVISTDEERHNPIKFTELMLESNARMIICTPSFLNNIISYDKFAAALKNLSTLLLGAEAFPSSLYESIRKIAPNIQLLNGYGPTECTICCSTKELCSGKGITIGKPTGNVKMYVTDKFGHILPPYGTGELIICGDGVGRGYVKLPEKNKASFFTLQGLPAYHSGDLVRLSGNAEIDFSGRIDNQIKLRGFRIELDEIEKVMTGFDGVLLSKVIVRNNGTEDYLAGFFTAEKQTDIDALTAYMKSKLAYYMVPSVMMQLDSMPLTANGKIDKKAFPETKQTVSKKSGRRAPKKSLEQRLCEIYASVLGQEEVFADDNFFELGGTSLSASKVTMLLMSDKIDVKYGDIFDHPTPELLAEFIEERDGSTKSEKQTAQVSENITREALRYNTVKYSPETERKPLGNVLLTGAVGFLGIHLLYELLQIETGHIFCLVRKGQHQSAQVRLKAMLIYYFSNSFDEAFKNRITVIDADITDDSLDEVLAGISFDTVINSAACVKHFSDSDILERINIHGVENLIKICRKRNAKLVQISTVSVPGIHTDESYEKQIRMHENELFMIDSMDNKYILSKYQAELRMFDAIESGMRGKVIRVGNLMGRHSDGEFQVNMETNMFMSGIRGFAIMGKYPISHMTDPMSFSPVDCTARAVVLLAGVNDKFTAFNANNRYGFDEMKIIDACNRNGITIYPEKDEIYYKEFREKLGNDSVNDALNGLAAYDVEGAHVVDTDNLFTANILYRIGFSWPLVDDTYLDRAIHSIMTLDYFDMNTSEDY